MSWWAVDVLTPTEQRSMMGAWLVSRTGQAVEERQDGTLVAFAPDRAAAEALIAELGRTGTPPVSVQSHQIASADWATCWKDGLRARRLGQLTIVPSWLPEAAEPGQFTVVLDPETAFGSGEHGSTRAALILMDRIISRGDQVLDLGSGSGILTIAAAKLGASRAIGIEIDPEANQVAVRNAQRNGVSATVQFLDGDAATLAPLVGPADLVLSNILRSINTLLLPTIARALRSGGRAIFSGMEQLEAEEFRVTLQDGGFEPIQETLDSGWWGVAAKLRE